MHDADQAVTEGKDVEQFGDAAVEHSQRHHEGANQQRRTHQRVGEEAGKGSLQSDQQAGSDEHQGAGAGDDAPWRRSGWQ